MRLYEAIAIACDARRNCIASGNEEWERRWYERIRYMQRSFLPSGSGFDSGSEIDIDSTTRQIKIGTSFHHMNENGFYDGWTDHIVRVRPNLAHRIEVTVSGRNRDDIKSHIDHTFRWALDQEVTWEDIDGMS